VDPTWGPAPQLLFSLQLAQKQEQRFLKTGQKDKRIEQLLHALVTVPEFFNFLNKFLERDISRLAGPLGFVLTLPLGNKLLTIENKVRFLEYRSFAKTRSEHKMTTCKIFPPRPDLTHRDACLDWLDTVSDLLVSQRYAKGQRLEVRFTDNEGRFEEGYGIGPTREFFSLVGEVICRHLFVSNPSGQWLLPSDDSEDGPTCKAAGMLVAVSVVSAGRSSLSRIFRALWEFIAEGDIGYVPDTELLADWDPDLARSMRFIAENDVEDNEDIQVLLEGANKFQFIASQVRKHLLTENMRQFRAGFFQALDEEWIVDFLDRRELAVVFGAADGEEINIADWKAHTGYSGYSSGDPQIVWFWELLETLPDSERRLVLLFATGMTAPPLSGFGAMTTSGGDLMPFTIMRTQCGEALPTAATCFNLLKLPAYLTRATLNEKMLTAIRLGSQGFTSA
jgi:hypothetical protein